MELWRDIPGYDGMYQASNEGRIKSVDRILPHAKTGTAIRKEHILSQIVSQRKRSSLYDARVNLSKEGHDKRFLVARLVAMAWVPGYREDLTVNHINGDSLDNRPENLEWISRKRNIQLAFEMGAHANQKPVFLIDRDGNKLRFYSIGQAGRYLGRSRPYIKNCLQKQKPAVSSISGLIYGVA